MTKILCASLLLALAATAHAQTVALRACNPGKTDVDVYFAQGSNVVAQHVAPTYCARLAFSQGAMEPGLVAVGFADAKGQWGGVHRYERVPTFGPGVAQATTQTLSVMHGGAAVTLPSQFRFQPPKPVCVTYRGAESTNPFVKTAEYTRCDELVYDVNVLAFPDTREVAFQVFCQPCDDQAEARKTPELRAAEKQIADLKQAAIDNLPMSIRIPLERDTKQQAVNRSEEPMDRYLESLERDPTKWDRIGWSDVPRYAFEVASLTAPNVAMKGSVAVLQGTLSGMQRHNASDPWYDVFFQESADHKFIVCTQTPDVLSDIFGASYATAMVGKKIEVEGKVVACLGGRPGILLKLAHQIKLVGTGSGMVAAVTPPAFKFPDDPNRPPPAAPVSASDLEAGKLSSARDLLERHCKALYTPATFLRAGGNNLEPDPALVKADVTACMERFDLAKLVPHEQAAIHYCDANHNVYAAQRDQQAVQRAWAECMAQNDPLTIPCEEWRRTTPQPPGNYDTCASEVSRYDGPIPSTPPGLPAIELPPATAKAAMAKTLAAAGLGQQGKPLNAPATAPAQAQRPSTAPASPASPPNAAPASPQVARKDRARPTQENMLRLQTCSQEAARQFPGGIASDPAGYQKAVMACINR